MLGPQSIDSRRVYEIALAGRDGASLAGVFDGTETFAAKVWTGDDQPSLVDLAPRWATAGDGMEFSDNPAGLDSPVLLLPVPAASLASLSPGLYRVQILINPGVDDVEAFLDLIEFTAAAGSATAVKVYCGFDDCRRLLPIVAQLIGRDPSLQSDLAEPRAWARQWLNRQLLCRAARILEQQRDRHEPVARTNPIVPTGGVDAGPEWGPSVYPDTTFRDQLAAIAALLDDDRLMTDDGSAATITAHYALYLACDAQLGGGQEGSSETDWQAIAAKHRKRANQALRGYDARIDSDGDGVADYVLVY